MPNWLKELTRLDPEEVKEFTVDEAESMTPNIPPHPTPLVPLLAASNLNEAAMLFVVVAQLLVLVLLWVASVGLSLAPGAAVLGA